MAETTGFRHGVYVAFHYIAGLFVLGVVAQVFLAGVGAFGAHAKKVEDAKISTRTGYLALLSNLAMLSGLLGTIAGLIKSFGAVGGESVDPSQKARILAEGISECLSPRRRNSTPIAKS